MKEESNRNGLYREELPWLKAAPMYTPAKFPPELHPENRPALWQHIQICVSMRIDAGIQVCVSEGSTMICGSVPVSE